MAPSAITPRWDWLGHPELAGRSAGFNSEVESTSTRERGRTQSPSSGVLLSLGQHSRTPPAAPPAAAGQPPSLRSAVLTGQTHARHPSHRRLRRGLRKPRPTPLSRPHADLRPFSTGDYLVLRCLLPVGAIRIVELPGHDLAHRYRTVIHAGAHGGAQQQGHRRRGAPYGADTRAKTSDSGGAERPRRSRLWCQTAGRNTREIR